MNIELTVLIGIVGTILGAILGILGYKRNTTNDKKQELKDAMNIDNALALSNTKLEIKLDYISKNVDEIRINQKDINKQVMIIGDRLTIVEQDCKSAHKRLDNMEASRK